MQNQLHIETPKGMEFEKNDVETSHELLEQEGMDIYQQIVDKCDTCDDEMSHLIARMRSVDTTGQFMASTARYLAAVDRDRYAQWLPSLIEGAIERDRERKYIGSLLEAIWGPDYDQNIEQLKATDNNFRRIYKRIHPEENVM